MYKIEKFILKIGLIFPKSYVICEENGKIAVYVSPISSRTLNKRAESKNILEGLHI